MDIKTKTQEFFKDALPIFIPGPLQKEDLKFIKLEFLNKRPIEGGWSRKKCYRFNDPGLLEHMEKGRNYGVRGGDGGLKILDIDDFERAKELGLIDALPKTFAVKTPHNGRHYYFICPEIEKKMILYDIEDHKRHIGELQAEGQFVVGPTCRFRQGNEATGDLELGLWEIERDCEIATIGKDELLEALNGRVWIAGQAEEKKEQVREEEKKRFNRFSHIKIEDIVKPVDIKRDDGVEIQGRHPIHGSTNGMNFSINRRDNTWVCYRHMAGGGILEWIAVEAGIVECGETQRGWYKKLNRGQRKKLSAALQEKGITVPTETINKDAGGLYSQVQKAIERFSWDNEAGEYEVFVYGGKLARILKDGRIDILNRDNLGPILDRTIDFIKIDSQGITHRIYPPDKVILGVLNANEWPGIPELIGVSKIPIVREDMSICTKPGYDPETKMYYLGEEMEIPTLSREEAIRTIGEIDDLIFSGFEFSDPASKGNAWFMLFQGMMRHLFRKVPYWYITKPDVASGASTLSAFPALICDGDSGYVIKESTGEEIDKRIDSAFAQGAKFVTIDNVKDVTKDSYNSIATEEMASFRPLGKTQLMRVKNNCMITFNGINLTFTDDTARRGLITELEPNNEKVWGGGEIKDKVAEKRIEIVKGLLGVLKSWVAAGMPRQQEKIPQFVSFESEINIINPILKYVGITEALTNSEVAKEEFDPDREEFDEFIQNWAVILGDKKVYNGELLKELEKFPKDTLPSKVRKGLLEGDVKEIVYYFRRHRGKKYSGGLKMEKGDVQGRRYWRVVGAVGAEEQDQEREAHFERKVMEKILDEV